MGIYGWAKGNYMKKFYITKTAMVLGFVSLALTNCIPPDINEYYCAPGLPLCRNNFIERPSEERIVWENTKVSGILANIENPTQPTILDWEKSYQVFFYNSGKRVILDANKEKVIFNDLVSPPQEFSQNIMTGKLFELEVQNPPSAKKVKANCFDVTYEKNHTGKVIVSYYWKGLLGSYYTQTGYTSYVFKEGKYSILETHGTPCTE